MQITEFEKKRASNLFWNGAEDYSAAPLFLMYGEDGTADLYMNSIIGSAYLYFDFDRLLDYYRQLKDSPKREMLETMFWTAVEDAAFQLAVERRRPLAKLRETANESKRTVPSDSSDTLSRLTPGDIRTTDELLALLHRELDPLLGNAEGGERADRALGGSLFQRFIPFFSIFGSARRFGGPAPDAVPVRHTGFGYTEHTYEYRHEVLNQHKARAHYGDDLVQTEETVEQYIYEYYGKPYLSENRMQKLAREILTGNHRDAKLHITRGETAASDRRNTYAQKAHIKNRKQIETNRAFFDENSRVHQLTIRKLADRIRNSLLTSLSPETVRTRSGELVPSRIYRALYLHDDRIFKRDLPGTSGNITVDLLLDSSTSQLDRQPSVAAQGYIIAEALTRCGIPVRVSGFSSMNGYTILEIFRGYEEAGENEQIFRYHTSGANRDGLALRLMGALLKENTAEYRILILLTDCKPNDVIKIQKSDGTYKDYEGETGVNDTADEVRRLIRGGIRPLCVFTGNDEDLPSVHKIFGSRFVRIRSFDLFAEAVSNLLQNEIRMMG